MTRRVWVGIAVTGAALAGWWVLGRMTAVEAAIETAEVTRGEFVERLLVRGEVQAQRSVLLTAPSDAGELRIVELAANGTPVKAGDVVIGFDPTSLTTRLQEKSSALREAEAEIARAFAEGRITLEEYTTALLTAQYDVERARLDVRAGELSSRYDERKAQLSLSDAQQRLVESSTTVDTGREVTAATVRGLEGKQERAAAEVERTRRGVTALTVRAPSDGVFVVLDNWRASQMGMGARPFQVGDSAWPGAQIAELPDLSTARMVTTVDEVDRSRLAVGQQASLTIDAIAGRPLDGRIERISTLAKMDMSTWPPKRGFEVVVALDEVDERLRPGMSANARVVLARLPDQVLVPARAVFVRDGATVAFVRRGGTFERRPVAVAHRSDEMVAIQAGLVPGEQVALVEPAAEMVVTR
jgi:HlyD family secretion protein